MVSPILPKAWYVDGLKWDGMDTEEIVEMLEELQRLEFEIVYLDRPNGFESISIHDTLKELRNG